MPKSAVYYSLKTLVASWLVFFVATIGQILLPMQSIKKLILLNSLIPDSLIASHLKLASLIFSNNLTIFDRIVFILTSATAGFLGSIKEICVIIAICNFTIFRGMERLLNQMCLIYVYQAINILWFQSF